MDILKLVVPVARFLLPKKLGNIIHTWYVKRMLRRIQVLCKWSDDDLLNFLAEELDK